MEHTNQSLKAFKFVSRKGWLLAVIFTGILIATLCVSYHYPILDIVSKFNFGTRILLRQQKIFPFNAYNFSVENDVLVFLRIQKTSTVHFEINLVENVVWDVPCKCPNIPRSKIDVWPRCNCLTEEGNTWLWAAKSVGWRGCGGHADWTELKWCLEDEQDRLEKHKRNRRYLYMTFVREPIHRFISEFKHIKRGATWADMRLMCNGRRATRKEVPRCYKGRDWKYATLDDFITCPSNLAINRQTRMLSNLSLVNCYNQTSMSPEIRDHIILESAKQNLQEMAFFGLTEYQGMSQELFQRTFNLSFKHHFIQSNHTRASEMKVSNMDIKRIKQLNKRDIQFYAFAEKLFLERCATVGISLTL